MDSGCYNPTHFWSLIRLLGTSSFKIQYSYFYHLSLNAPPQAKLVACVPMSHQYTRLKHWAMLILQLILSQLICFLANLCPLSYLYLSHGMRELYRSQFLKLFIILHLWSQLMAASICFYSLIITLGSFGFFLKK